MASLGRVVLSGRDLFVGERLLSWVEAMKHTVQQGEIDFERVGGLR